MKNYSKQIYMPYVNIEYVSNAVEVIKVFKLSNNFNYCCAMSNMIYTTEDIVFSNKKMLEFTLSVIYN